MFQPVIKWSGSKRSQSSEILKHIPNKINTYYEPFCGGCSILRSVIESDIIVKRYICSDINNDLIALWNAIKERPLEVVNWYTELWYELNKDDDLERKKEYFYTIRQRLNEEHNPLDFMFIMRTTTNGMPRYNQNGDFNNSFHVTRKGINPNRLKDIVAEWSNLLNSFDVQFNCMSYSEIISSEDDFLYLDPPYANTKGMYFGSIDVDTFFDWLRKQVGKYIFSFDGISNNDNTFDVPKDIYKKHLYIESGNSSFRRVIGKSKDCIVKESLYINV